MPEYQTNVLHPDFTSNTSFHVITPVNNTAPKKPSAIAVGVIPVTPPVTQPIIAKIKKIDNNFSREDIFPISSLPAFAKAFLEQS